MTRGMKLVLLALWSISCARTAPVQRNMSEFDSGPEPEEDLQKTGSTITQKEPISVLELDKAEFKVTGVTAGIVSFMNSQAPVVSYNLPQKANYIELIRCDCNTKLLGTIQDLENIELGDPKRGEDAALVNDYWAAAERANGQCELLSADLSFQEFIDYSAPSGCHIYLTRACVITSRLIDANKLGTRACSYQVSRSQSLDGFVNRRDKNAAEKLARLRDLENRINASTIQIYNITVAFNDAVEDCEEEERDRQARVKRKQAFTKILGTGLAVGGKILAGGVGGPSDWKSVWQERDSLAGQGNSIGTALNWLFASADDFPKVCSTAIRLQHDGDIEKERLRSLHQSYAITVKEAELATGMEIVKNRDVDKDTKEGEEKDEDEEK